MSLSNEDREKLNTRCGVRWGPIDLTLPEDDEFTSVCRYLHDPAWQNMYDGFPGRSLAVVDAATLKAWLGIASNKPTRWQRNRARVKALAMYAVAHLYGILKWHSPRAVIEKPEDP